MTLRRRTVLWRLATKLDLGLSRVFVIIPEVDAILAARFTPALATKDLGVYRQQELLRTP